MSRREAWLTAGLIFVVGLLVRAWAAGQIPFPIPEDATYYWGAARNLAQGDGLTSNAIWSFGTPARDASGAAVLGFPRPAFEIWLPLASLLAAVPMAVTGSTSYATSLVVPVLLGALVPVLAWRIAADVATERDLGTERARTLAIGVGLVGAVWMPLVLPGAVLDSTTPFGVAALAACLVAARLASHVPSRPWDARVVLLGLLIGVAALSRNEAIWLGLAWVVVAAALARRTGRGVGWFVATVGTAGLVAVLVMSPWLIRNWLTFGSPLPGQAITNAFSLSGHDIFAWQDPPTLGRYLAAGAGTLIGHRVDGLGHNVLDVLVVPGFPVSLIGVAALPWFGRSRALRPLVLTCILIFGVTTIFFPVATTWGTFLHAAVPVLVLLLVVGMAALDAGLAAVGRWRGWTRPTAWLAPVFAGLAALLFTGLAIPAYGGQAARTEADYGALGARLAAAGHPLDPAMPVIAAHPMWVAEANRARAVGLPDEPVGSIVDLARAFGARYLVLDGKHGGWPARLATDPDRQCLQPLVLPPVRDDRFAVYEVVCP